MWLKKIWIKLAAPAMAAELQDHLDCLLAAQQPAEKFGDPKKILALCLAAKQKDYYKFCLIFYFFTLGLILWLAVFLSSPAVLLQAYLIILAYLWTLGAVILIAARTVSKIFQYFGRESLLAWGISLSLAQLLTLALVIFYDLDGLEIIMENSTLLIIIFTIGILLKKIRPKIYFILAQISLIITALMAMFQKPLNFFGQLKCLFLTPDYDPLPQALAACQQISLVDFLFLPFWLSSGLALMGFLYFIYFLFFKNSLLGPKILVSSVGLSLIIIPSLFYDFNNYHRLNLIFYQPVIIKIYRQLLSRDPAPEDLDFYASHETYRHLDRIAATLKESAEYKQKNND